MNLRELLDLCSGTHSDAWVRMPGAQGGRPATAFAAGIFDPGFEDARTRPLAGHTIAVYEPDARISMVWPVVEDDDEDRGRFIPEWLEADGHQWKNARS